VEWMYRFIDTLPRH